MNGRSIKAGLLCISLMILGGSMSACATGAVGLSGDSWQEEALLHDGKKLIVERSVDRGGRHEIGQQPPVKEQSLTFTLPETGESVIWKSEFSKDVGLADLSPLMLDIFQRTPYLVTHPVGCLAYNKWGRPNPPYVIFRYDGKSWQRIPVHELPAALTAPNLIISSPDSNVKKLKTRDVTVAMVQAANRDLTQPEYKTILREAVKPGMYGSSVNCEAMIHYKCGWFGTGPDGKLNKEFADRMCR